MKNFFICYIGRCTYYKKYVFWCCYNRRFCCYCDQSIFKDEICPSLYQISLVMVVVYDDHNRQPYHHHLFS